MTKSVRSTTFCTFSPFCAILSLLSLLARLGLPDKGLRSQPLERVAEPGPGPPSRRGILPGKTGPGLSRHQLSAVQTRENGRRRAKLTNHYARAKEEYSGQRNRASSAGIELRPVYGVVYPAAIRLLPDSFLWRPVFPAENPPSFLTESGPGCLQKEVTQASRRP